MELEGYIIEKYNNMSNAYTCNRLVEEARRQGIDLRIIGIHDTMMTPDGLSNKGELLEKRDFVINRYKWGRVKDEINHLARKCYNRLDAYDVYINKYLQIKNLKSSCFVMPKYVLGSALLPFDEIISYLGTPIVAKGLESSMGEQISLVKNSADLELLVQRYGSDKEWLFEEYISTSYGRDIRFYSIRGNIIACMQRKSNGDFRANVALGASVEPYEITDGMKTIAKDIYLQTGLDFLGIDLMFGIDKPYFGEINVMPGIEGIEMASKKNVAEEIIKTIKGDFENE